MGMHNVQQRMKYTIIVLQVPLMKVVFPQYALRRMNSTYETPMLRETEHLFSEKNRIY